MTCNCIKLCHMPPSPKIKPHPNFSVLNTEFVFDQSQVSHFWHPCQFSNKAIKKCLHIFNWYISRDKSIIESNVWYCNFIRNAVIPSGLTLYKNSPKSYCLMAELAVKCWISCNQKPNQLANKAIQRILTSCFVVI